MDISFELGVPLGAVRAMPEREIRTYMAYTARRHLPSRRIELLLAQLAMLIDCRIGKVEDARLSDYLFDPDVTSVGSKQEDQAIDVAEQQKAFGFNPINRKKG